mmetsp:Transcript_26489/g.22678  ORF Transcript_26489/g.22678 Transcript_26489/m.22678 type:complete len:111 (+) Transcript_26489:42-374(+)
MSSTASAKESVMPEKSSDDTTQNKLINRKQEDDDAPKCPFSGLAATDGAKCPFSDMGGALPTLPSDDDNKGMMWMLCPAHWSPTGMAIATVLTVAVCIWGVAAFKKSVIG